MAGRILGQTPHYSCLGVERVSHPTSLRADPHLAVTEKLIRVGQDWGQAPTLPLALLMNLSPNKTHAVHDARSGKTLKGGLDCKIVREGYGAKLNGSGRWAAPSRAV
ncbi:hypothetical protein RRG08_046057 [Elysia crispata]|uniref:Uncharacterized protein n=1 Tax=Elysia crispata TaxID=231223 RepID=A0AAE1DVQ4_9GAST|nr:hypothetical protein RRG08_046057 [Elysia crispata]